MVAQSLLQFSTSLPLVFLMACHKSLTDKLSFFTVIDYWPPTRKKTLAKVLNYRLFRLQLQSNWLLQLVDGTLLRLGGKHFLKIMAIDTVYCEKQSTWRATAFHFCSGVYHIASYYPAKATWAVTYFNVRLVSPFFSNFGSIFALRV